MYTKLFCLVRLVNTFQIPRDIVQKQMGKERFPVLDAFLTPVYKEGLPVHKAVSTVLQGQLSDYVRWPDHNFYIFSSALKFNRSALVKAGVLAGCEYFPDQIKEGQEASGDWGRDYFEKLKVPRAGRYTRQAIRGFFQIRRSFKCSTNMALFS